MCVLVVDDNVDTARLIAMLLCGEGHDATAVFDGQIAIEEAKARQPDVIILDLGLPGMDGLEVCRQLRLDDRFKRTLLVALTGYGQDEDQQRTRQAGFDVHLVKPVKLDQLKRRLLILVPKLHRDRAGVVKRVW